MTVHKQLITHSRCQSFKKCRKKHYFEYEAGMRKYDNPKAIRMGSSGHDALDALKSGEGIEEAMAVLETHYRICPESVELYDWQIEETTMRCLILGYQSHWHTRDFEVIKTEQTFQLPLRNPATGVPSRVWDVAGKIDGIVTLEDGRTAILEHKFISDDIDPNSRYWDRLQIDSQISLYLWAARQLGYDAETVLYDVVRKPTIKPTAIPTLDIDGKKIVVDHHGKRIFKGDGKPRQSASQKDGWVLQSRLMTPEEWANRLLDDIEKKPSRYYARHEIVRLDSDLVDCLSEVWEIQKTIRTAQKSNYWYKTVEKDTCGYCSFFGLCSSKYEVIETETPEGFIRLAKPHPELEN